MNMSFWSSIGKGESFGQRTAPSASITGANMIPPTDLPEKIPEGENNENASPLTLTIHPDLTTRKKIQVIVEDEPKKTRVLFCGTYPVGQSNGYSRVVYYISKYLGLKEDIDLTIYGFQNFRQATTSTRNDIPDTVKLHDAFATENPKRNGFGENEIADFLKKNPQDIVIIFNDSVVTTMLVKNIVEQMTETERASFKLVSYMDQVYPYQRSEYIQMINQYFHAVIAFTPYWKDVARKIGIKPEIPIYYFPHGFDPKLYYPIPKKVARLFYQLPEDAFILLNLNRNQPRKRWDHTIMAYADVVQRHMELVQKEPHKKHRPILLMVATAMTGFWDLLELFDLEIKKRNLPVEKAREYLTTIAKPQQMSDRDINIMYNACDIGLNTCEGEGFGLCQFEHLAVGCPQVAANLGGFKEFLHAENSILVEPKWFYYVDKVRDGIGGYAEVSDPKDVADAIWKYYTQPKLVSKHGLRGRQEVLQHYRWDVLIDLLHQAIVKTVANAPSTKSTVDNTPSPMETVTS